MQIDPNSRARDKVLYLLKTRGPLTSGQLAAILKITAIAVRQHLQVLEEDDLVTHTIRKGKVGRPAHVWHLTPAANQLFPNRHADLTLTLLDALESTLGEKGMKEVLHVWAQKQEEKSRALFGSAPENLRERIEALVKMRRDQGYMAEFKEKGDGSFELIENHCPISEAAGVCEEICEGEGAIFARLLGEDVRLKRLEHILSGDRRCLYEVRPDPAAAESERES